MNHVPPANVEAEKVLLGTALAYPERVEEWAADLLLDEFFSPANRHVWEAIQTLRARGATSDVLAVTDELKASGVLLRFEDGEAYLLEVARHATIPDRVQRELGIVKEKAALRRLVQLGVELTQRAYAQEALESIVGRVREAIEHIESAGAEVGPVKLRDAIGPALEEIEQRYRNPRRYAVMTGLRKFDRIIGGLKPEKLIVVAAPPGKGKSAWANTVLVNAAKAGVPGLIFSLEMGRQELIERELSGEARVNNSAIGTGQVASSTEAWSPILDAGRRLSKLPIEIDDREMLTIRAWEAAVRRWYLRTFGPVPPKDQPPNPALVIVDYLQIMSKGKDDDSENRTQLVGAWTRAMKRVARALRIPVVALSQLNRKHADRGGKPVMSDLRDSGNIEQDADMVIFLWGEEAKDEEGREVPGQSGPVEQIVAKNRGGLVGVIEAFFHREFTRFEDLEREPDTDTDTDTEDRRYPT